jgi:hypothetical protein
MSADFLKNNSKEWENVPQAFITKIVKKTGK